MLQREDDDEGQKLVGIFAHFHINLLQWVVLSNKFQIFVEVKQKLRARFRFTLVQLMRLQLEQ